MAKEISRGIEVLVKKAAVDPRFKQLFLEKRAGAAAEIALDLSPAEEEILNTVPAAQLEAIVASTKVSPKLRPAFLGYAAAAMLATLASTAAARAHDRQTEEGIIISTGIRTNIPSEAEGETEDYGADITVPEDAGVIYGKVYDEFGEPFPNVTVTVAGTELTATSNLNGFYVLTPVPPGTYDLTFYCKGLAPERRSKVEVKAGYKTNITVRLYEREEHLVTGIRPDPPPKKGE